MSTWEGNGGYGDIEFSWSDDIYVPTTMQEGRTASLAVQEPYRESYGHSAWVTPEMARGLAAELIAFADWCDANPSLPAFRPSI